MTESIYNIQIIPIDKFIHSPQQYSGVVVGAETLVGRSMLLYDEDPEVECTVKIVFHDLSGEDCPLDTLRSSLYIKEIVIFPNEEVGFLWMAEGLK